MLAYWAVLIGVFITSLYSLRLLFVVFHGEGAHGSPHEGASARDAVGRDGAA
jgi:NADH-quinone oxidoreductase subunit L